MEQNIDSNLTSDLCLVFVNVQCLRTKSNLLNLLVTDVQPSILCISEHWLCENEVNSYMNIEDLNLGDIFLRESRKGGGSAIYVHKNFTFRTIDLKRFCSETDLELSGVLLPNLNVAVVSVYRAPAGDMNIFMRGWRTVWTSSI